MPHPMWLYKTIYTTIQFISRAADNLFANGDIVVIGDLQGYSSHSVMDLMPHTKEAPQKVSVLEEEYYVQKNK